jgi:hypothetical protein
MEKLKLSSREEKDQFLDQFIMNYGYEDWDLLLTVMDNVIKDLGDYWDTRDQHKDHKEILLPLYKLFGELVISDRNLLMQYLPKGNSPYEDKLVGGLR